MKFRSIRHTDVCRVFGWLRYDCPACQVESQEQEINRLRLALAEKKTKPKKRRTKK